MVHFMILVLGDVKGGLDELHVGSNHRNSAAHMETMNGGGGGSNPVPGLPIHGSLSGHNLGAMSSSSSSSLGLMPQVK